MRVLSSGIIAWFTPWTRWAMCVGNAFMSVARVLIIVVVYMLVVYACF